MIDGSCTDAFWKVIVWPPLDEDELLLELELELELLDGGGVDPPPPPPPQAIRVEARTLAASGGSARYRGVMARACLRLAGAPMCKSLRCDYLFPAC